MRKSSIINIAKELTKKVEHLTEGKEYCVPTMVPPENQRKIEENESMVLFNIIAVYLCL